MTSRLHFLFACAALLLAGVVRADTTIYKCVDADGRVEFTDSVRRNCKALDLPSSYAAPKARGGGGNGRTASAPAPVPADFPKVSNVQQKNRDDERRDILNEELRSEEKKLADIRREFNGGEPERQGNERNYAKYQERVALLKDSISRAEKNIDALKREIGNIK
ncbi:DUF4124 domain-containing protein [Massilia sp. PWRC2]|uniref:DUF4124 domain-containing protein n=1 Tax=Massilia sp. PWRC2 TaxID=2804626 RepID=UPI003CED717D